MMEGLTTGHLRHLRGIGAGADRERPLPRLRSRQAPAPEKILIDYVHVERSEITETGEYDLDGLFIRLADAVDTIGAKRIVLDTLETLFSSLPNKRSCAPSCAVFSAG